MLAIIVIIAGLIIGWAFSWGITVGILIYGLLFDPSMFVHHVVVTAK